MSRWIFIKFGMDIIFPTRICSIIQSCSPGGTTAQEWASHIAMHANISIHVVVYVCVCWQQFCCRVDLECFGGVQVALMQKYAVLIGMNGAGLTNGLYLPPGGVVIQLVPHRYRLQVNNVAFGELLRGGAGGGYLEWHNKHANLTDYQHGDTVVAVSEIVDIARRALDMFESAQRRQAKDEL